VLARESLDVGRRQRRHLDGAVGEVGEEKIANVLQLALPRHVLQAPDRGEMAIEGIELDRDRCRRARGARRDPPLGAQEYQQTYEGGANRVPHPNTPSRTAASRQMRIDEAAHEPLVDLLQSVSATHGPMREVRHGSQIALDRAGRVAAASQPGRIGIYMRAQDGPGQPVAGRAWKPKTELFRHDDSPS